jgi:pyruvate dehydrogenase E1 component beta subunit
MTKTATAAMTMVEALNGALREAMEEDPRIVVFGEDVGVFGGVFRVTDGLQEKFGPERVFDTPIAESGIVGAGVGYCLAGFHPVVEMQFEGFSYPAFNQIITHVSRYRTRTYGHVSIPMVIRMPYGGGVGASEHHSESPEAYYAHTPGLKVAVASTAQDGRDLLLAAVRDPDPVILFESKARYQHRDQVDLDAEPLGIGRARVVREGADCTVITYGPPVHTALAVAGRLAGEGIEVGVIDVRSLVPLDAETIIGSVQRSGRAVVVHEAPRTAGFGAELAARISAEAFLSLEAPVERVCGPDIPYPGPGLEQHYLPTAERIAAAVRRTLG